jgi:DNA-binding MarR family transcriptional regulator
MPGVHDDSILRSLRRISRAVDVYSRRLSATYNLTAPQLVCLRTLALSEARTPSQLAKEAALSQATVTGILDRLERRGLVHRHRDEKDRRKVILEVSEQGRELMQAAPPPLQERFASRLAELPEAQQKEIDRVLRRIAEMMTDDLQEHGHS